MTTYEAYHRQATGLKLYGGVAQAWNSKAPVIVVSGPYETGKTLGLLHKLDALLWKYGRARALMVRQTYKSLLSSARVTYEKLIGDDSPVEPYGGEKPEFYTYPNGSLLFLGGLDKPDKFLSSEWDFVYINQVEELLVDSFEKLCARATGRAGNAPYTQVLADCNPSYPSHWILEKRSKGELVFLEQLHKHNPALCNPETGELTAQGRITMSKLQLLTGIRRDRGLLNKWVAAEGVVYDNFSLTENITEEAEYKPGLDVYWGVDDGYAHGDGPGSAGHHPRVILLAQLQANGGLDVFAEYYQTLQLPEQSIEEVLSWPYPKPVLAKVDSSAAELRRRLIEYDIMNGGATHLVADGIKVVRRFICDGQGQRLLRIHPRCKNLIREMQMYRYDDKSHVAVAGEPKPLKLDDHCPDALRYLIWNFR